MAVQRLAEFVRQRAPIVVISGAGISTGSGIGDYRDPRGEWKRKPPIDLQAFLNSHAARRRYWARSLLGFPEFARAKPNAGHRAVAALETLGLVHGVITQNVDDLHQQAGQMRIEALHGRLGRVRCLACDAISSRHQLQNQLEADNQQFLDLAATPAPDGDADLEDADLTRFEVPACAACGGTLKPDVVFFGDSVPKPRVTRCRELVGTSGGMLVVGSSLMVYSSYRFVRLAAELGIPVAIVNRGVTRADHLQSLKFEADCEDLLPSLVDAL